MNNIKKFIKKHLPFLYSVLFKAQKKKGDEQKHIIAFENNNIVFNNSNVIININITSVGKK